MAGPAAAVRAEDGMRIEVEVVKDATGLFTATAVPYPSVTATGRTEKEALGLLMEALGRFLKSQARRAAGREP